MNPKPDFKPNMIARLMLTASVALLAGCIRPEADFTRFRNFDSRGWPADVPVEFQPDSATMTTLTGRNADIILTLRYSAATDVETLPVEFLTEGFDTEARRDTLSLRLFEGDRPLGKGTYALYTLSDTLPAQTIPDGLRLTLTPLSGAKGIQSVGISIIRR